MKKIIKAKVLVLAGFLIFLSACTSEFDELNTNPNAATDVPATNVLGSSMLNSCIRCSEQDWTVIIPEHTLVI